MKKFGKIIIFVFFTLVMMFSFNKSFAASDFDLEKLKFDVKVNQDGSMDVAETWQVDINGTTNTLFKTFSNDGEKLKNISVSEISNSEEVKFDQSNVWKNHVNTNYFHALFHKGDFEIAWGVNKSEGRHTYIVRYTVTDAVTVYNDCAEIYWQFIGKNFEVPANEVTGKITLPNAVEMLDNLRVWGHGGLNGDIRREDNKTVTFTMSPFITGNFLEVRTAILEPEMFELSNNKIATNRFDSIIEEETSWADKANRERELIATKKVIITYGATGVSLAVGVGFIAFIVKGIKKLKETSKIEPSQRYEYFREIPNESETPAEVAFLYYYKKSAQNTYMPRVLSSTMLDLSLKKHLTFEVDENKTKKEQVTIKLTDDPNAATLKESEKLVLDLFRKIPKESINPQFNMKDFEKYAKKHNSSFINSINRIEKQARKEQESIGHYNKKMEEHCNNWATGGAMIFVLLALFSVFSMAVFEINILPLVCAIIPGIVYSVICFAISGRYTGLTQSGIDEKEQWEALKKYMEDYSMIEDKEVPELVIWEKYLVYATLFGNAEKVLKQLKMVYPQFSDDEYMRNTTYFYLITHSNFNDSFVHSVDSAMAKAYQSSVAASSSSSGGGYGGGFSGGGGRRRRRWPEADGR